MTLTILYLFTSLIHGSLTIENRYSNSTAGTVALLLTGNASTYAEGEAARIYLIEGYFSKYREKKMVISENILILR